MPTVEDAATRGAPDDVPVPLASACAQHQAEQLVRVTGAIADAVSPEDVFAAIVDRVAATLGATGARLWLLADDGCTVTLQRAIGTHRDNRLDAPALAVIRSRTAAFTEAGPDPTDERAPHHLRLSTATLPMLVHDETLGMLELTFDTAEIDDEHRRFLGLVARYAGQALGRLRLLERERELRARAEILHGLAAAVISAEHVEEVFEPALDALAGAVGSPRAAILAYDEAGVMRFRAWRGLSDAYRAAVEGHSPWTPSDVDPAPLFVTDIATDPAWADYLPLFRSERIGALGFIPLLSRRRPIGKLMVYYDGPRVLRQQEIESSRAIANHVAAALTRFSSFAALQRTVRFNEMFTGMLGHDLRNPLSAMITSAQAAMMRPEGERLVRPLSRIVSSGNRMARMIEQLLDFTRMRVGDGIPIEPQALDLAALVRQVVDELDDANPDVILRLEHIGDMDGSWDPDRLSQVFSNLVANAIQHGEREHGIDVRIDGSDEAGVRVQIRNAGVIPEGDLGQLFEPMSAGSRRRDRSRGLGLGLYITHEIVRAHRGRIDVQSNAERGTQFELWLPRTGAKH